MERLDYYKSEENLTADEFFEKIKNSEGWFVGENFNKYYFDLGIFSAQKDKYELYKGPNFLLMEYGSYLMFRTRLRKVFEYGKEYLQQNPSRHIPGL
jgi:hypothetical protein